MNTPDSKGNPTVEPNKGTQSDKDTLPDPPDLPTTSEITRLATAILTATPGLHWVDAVKKALDYWTVAREQITIYATDLRRAEWEQRERFINTGILPLGIPDELLGDWVEGTPLPCAPSAISRKLWTFAEKITPRFPGERADSTGRVPLSEFLKEVLPGNDHREKYFREWLRAREGATWDHERDLKAMAEHGLTRGDWLQCGAGLLLSLRKRPRVRDYFGFGGKVDPWELLDRLVPHWEHGAATVARRDIETGRFE